MSFFAPLPPSWNNGKPSDGLVIVFSGSRLLLKNGGANTLPSGMEITIDCEGHLTIGRIGESACCVLELPEESPLNRLFRSVDLREALNILPEAEKIAVGRAREILFWRANVNYCAGCGASLAEATNECAKLCPNCGTLFFPVLAPAVIVAVRKGETLLLAHNRKFRAGMYSLIAGFVEAGENLEQTVAREVREEAGIEVKNIRYFGSQSWPFPNSLMLGFTAEYAGGELCPDGEEITDADWFEADAFPDIPSHGSISRTLIDHFVAQKKHN